MTLRRAAVLDALAGLFFAAVALAGRYYLRGNRA
jgi:hypothetical protein